jgi:hypothetical protein
MSRHPRTQSTVLAETARAKACVPHAIRICGSLMRMPYRCAVSVRAETGAAVRDHPDCCPDTRRPCQDWCAEQPVDETDSGQACGDDWWLRSGGAQTPLSSFERGVPTGSGHGPFLLLRRPSYATTPPQTLPC